MTPLEYLIEKRGEPTNVINGVPVFCGLKAGYNEWDGCVTIVHTIEVRKLKSKHHIELFGPYTTANFITSVVNTKGVHLKDFLESYPLPVKAIIV